MSNPAIRPATLADRDGYVGLVSQLFHEDAIPRDTTVDPQWPQTFVADAFTAGVEDPKRLFLVAAGEHVLVGSLSGSLTEPTAMRPVTVATLVSLYVPPDFRGDGFGAALVSRFKVWAREAGAERLAVTAYHGNLRAISFYQREGFLPYQTRLESDLL